MFQILYRVTLLVVWLTVTAVVLGGVLLHADWMAGWNEARMSVAGLIALLMTVYNVWRLVYLLRRRKRTSPPNPLRQPPAPPREYIPEFDFDRQEPPEQGAGDK